MFPLREKELADLIVQTLENMRNEHDFSLLCKQIKVPAIEIEAISPPALPRKWRKPNIQYCITLQETQRKQRQCIIWKFQINITNRFITKVSTLLLTPWKIDLINNHLGFLLKQSSCFWKQWANRMSQMSGKYWRHISKVTMMPIDSLHSFNFF